MRGLQIVLGFIFAALIAILIINLNQKPPRDDDDDDEDTEEVTGEETDKEDIEQVEEYGTGDLQVSLLWDFYADIDLHVTDPNGYEIGWILPDGPEEGHYQAKAPDMSPSGGQLDEDRVEGGPNSIENIFWAQNPPKGEYKVEVIWVSTQDSAAEDAPTSGEVRVVVRQTGKAPKTYRVQVRAPQIDEEQEEVSADSWDRVFVTNIKVR